MATITPPPRLAHMPAHMRGSLNIGRADSVKSPENGTLLQWESRGTRYIRVVGETIAPVSAPCFSRLKTLAGSKSVVGHDELVEQHFVGWLDYVYDLVVASWAFRVDLDSQVKNNLYFVRSQWEAGGRVFVRGHVDVGLANQISSLRAALEVPDDGVRFDALTLGSSVLEDSFPGMSSEATEGLAVAIRASANTFLFDEGTSRYRHAAAILALQRSIHSLPQESYIEARRELLGHYIARLHEEDTLGNAALLRSIVGLLWMFDRGAARDEVRLLQQLEGALQRIVQQTKSVAVRALVETVIREIPCSGTSGDPSSDPYAVQFHRAGDIDI